MKVQQQDGQILIFARVKITTVCKWVLQRRVMPRVAAGKSGRHKGNDAKQPRGDDASKRARELWQTRLESDEQERFKSGQCGL
jgi:hypothetical protein